MACCGRGPPVAADAAQRSTCVDGRADLRCRFHLPYGWPASPRLPCSRPARRRVCRQRESPQHCCPVLLGSSPAICHDTEHVKLLMSA